MFKVGDRIRYRNGWSGLYSNCSTPNRGTIVEITEHENYLHEKIKYYFVDCDCDKKHTIGVHPSGLIINDFYEDFTERINDRMS